MSTSRLKQGNDMKEMVTSKGGGPRQWLPEHLLQCLWCCAELYMQQLFARRHCPHATWTLLD